MENVNVNKICWNITEKCNRKCKHCFRFIDVKELSFEDNIKILMKLNEMETKMITWTGGEATLYPNCLYTRHFWKKMSRRKTG